MESTVRLVGVVGVDDEEAEAEAEAEAAQLAKVSETFLLDEALEVLASGGLVFDGLVSGPPRRLRAFKTCGLHVVPGLTKTKDKAELLHERYKRMPKNAADGILLIV